MWLRDTRATKRGSERLEPQKVPLGNFHGNVQPIPSKWIPKGLKSVPVLTLSTEPSGHAGFLRRLLSKHGIVSLCTCHILVQCVGSKSAHHEIDDRWCSQTLKLPQWFSENGRHNCLGNC